MLSQTLSYSLHPNLLGFLLHFRPNRSVLKSTLEEVRVLSSIDELADNLVLDGEASTVVLGVSVRVSVLGLMFLADLLRGITGGGFVVK